MTSGHKVKSARKMAGLTQRQLGALIGMKASQIGQYETGRRNPKLSTLKKIADALGISPFALIGNPDR